LATIVLANTRDRIAREISARFRRIILLVTG